MPYRPTPRQLEYLVALHETRHFGKAAKRCHVSQPSLSVQIGLVEASLGGILFERTSSGVSVTPLGEEIITRARTVLAMLDDIVDIAAQDSKTIGGLIRLGTAPTFGPYFLPTFLPSVHARFPDLEIYIREESPVLIEAAVKAGSLDCGLGPEPESAGLSFRPIGTERLFLGIPAEHSLAQKETITLGELRDERLLALGSGHRLYENVRELAKHANAHLVDDYQATSLDSIRQMVSIGMGSSLFPELYARSEFKNAEDVRLVEINGWSMRRAIGFYWREYSGRTKHYEVLANEADLAARKLDLAPAEGGI